MDIEKKQKIETFVNNYFILILIFWSTLLFISLWFNISSQKTKTIDIVTNIAQSNFNKDLAFRLWATSHGGVYVQPSETTPPSPWLSHLKDRDVVTTDGKKLTLMNPAYMLRQMMDGYSKLYGIKGKIAGIVYLNPQNEANKYEAAVIRKFEKGIKEVSELSGEGDGEFFNLSLPLFMEEGCQKCHGHLGFKNGEVRGSVGITVPMLPYRDIEFDLIQRISITHFFVWFFGLFGLLFVKNKTKISLIEKEEYLKEIEISSLVFDDTIDAILITNKLGVIIRVNNAFTKLTGYSSKEAIGEMPNLLKSEHHSEKFYELFWATILTKGLWQGEIWNKKKTGEIFVSKESISTVKDENGNILYMIAILHDITRQKEHEETIENFNKELHVKVAERTSELEQTILNLKQTQNKLVESEKMASLGGLVAGIAHEINTPVGIGITGISHFLDITNKISEDYNANNISQNEFELYLNSSKELATIIDTNLHRTADLVRSFKQISIDQSSEEKRIFYFKEYLETILLSISNITKKTNLTINVTCKEDIKINCYPGIFSQIFTNLIINSINHGYAEKEAGNITIEIFQQNNHITIFYKDDGKGISQDNLQKIFDPFFTTNRHNGGTGLGLNVIYNIVTNNLNGNITCSSEEGQGVLFEIMFDV